VLLFLLNYIACQKKQLDDDIQDGRPASAGTDITLYDSHYYFDFQEALSESIESEKSILFLITKNDDLQSHNFTDRFFFNSEWRDVLSDYFVLTDIDIYENPEISLNLLFGTSISLDTTEVRVPCLLLINPSNLETYSIVEVWDEHDLFSFPYRSEYEMQNFKYSPNDLTVQNKLEQLAADAGFDIPSYSINTEANNDRLDQIVLSIPTYRSNYYGNEPLLPEFCLLQAFSNKMLSQNLDLSPLVGRWTDNESSSNYDTNFILDVGLPWGVSYLDSYYGVSLYGNLKAIEFSYTQMEQEAIDIAGIYEELAETLIPNDGNSYKGFPVYLEYLYSLDDHPDVGLNDDFQKELIPGNRNLLWANARILEMWLKDIMLEPEMLNHELGDYQTLRSRLDPFAIQLTSETNNAINNMDSVTGNLAELTYGLRLNLRMYRYTRDETYLSEARSITEKILLDTSMEWDKCYAIPLLIDLSLGLWEFGVLDSNEPAQATANEVIESAIYGINLPYGTITQIQLAYTAQILYSDVINVIVVGAEDDANSNILFQCINAEWDPRIFSQYINRNNNLELLNRKEIPNSDVGSAYIFLNGELIEGDIRTCNDLLYSINNVLVEIASTQ